jgi:hypothetical protein
LTTFTVGPRVEIEAVHEDLYTKVPIPDVPAADEVSDSKITPERMPPILEYLERVRVRESRSRSRTTSTARGTRSLKSPDGGHC